MNIAVIGGGISGLCAAHLLSPGNDITLFEAGERLGGHTATRDIAIDGQQLSVDTGFIVFNDWTYPNFIRLMDSLSVASQPAEMGFSVTSTDGSLEYCGSNLNSLFADRRNLFNARFLGMLWDIIRFNRESKRDLAQERIDPEQSLLDYLRQGRYGETFINGYIVPMASAIWSSSSKAVEQFQALFFIRFFRNHGLLNLFNRPQWRVICGGSRSYVGPLTARFADRIRLAEPVASITRHSDHVILQASGRQHRFDQVIIATHSDQALKMLTDASPAEEEVLTAIPYVDNAVTMHTDTSVLPRSPRAWTSWNYLLDGSNHDRPVLSYIMNILQGFDCPQTICVSVNGDDHIDPDRIIERFTYAHPQFDARSVDAQSRWPEINGVNHTWFCGAYWQNGFHEDGATSGIRVARALGAKW